MSNNSQSQPQSTTGTTRSVTGFVTKLVGEAQNFGFINNEIFFPQTNVSNGPAIVGDQVFAECEYSPAMPIKWNASSVKILQRPQASQNGPRVDEQQAVSSTQLSSQPPVAMTYQQHRQQRQQNLLSKDSQLDQVHNQPEVFQPLPENEPPLLFSRNHPMGPPNFAFTSQLGSAFVQTQFPAASPFLAQQQPPQQINQTKLLPSTNAQGQHQKHNNNNNNQGNKNNRFNNFQDKGNEPRFNNQNRRNQDRNDNKNNRDRDRNKGRDRSNDRDVGNNRNRGARERSQGGNNKKDESSRVSPQPSLLSSRSSTDRQVKRRYDIQNIPKMLIMTTMNPQNMKLRCPSSLHVPSDLKEIFVNQHFRLDIKSNPKPIKFTIEQKKSTDEQSSTKDETTTKASTPNRQEDANMEEYGKSTEKPTPPTSKSDTRLYHKYGVKVILISIPDMEAIYEKVFGHDLNSFNQDIKLSNEKLDECISLLCGKGSNNGHSLIGGKFDPVLDGFVEGGSNKHERNGRQPDLIATSKRVVLDQTGLDLSNCRSWSLVSTLVYNNKSDYFSSKASAEYTYIYLPQIWTMKSESFDKKIINQESLCAESSNECDESHESDNREVPKIDSTDESENSSKVGDEDKDLNEVEPSSVDSGNLSDLKVADLKLELERRGVKFKGNPKKAELVAMLQESIQSGECQKVMSDSTKDGESQETKGADSSEKEAEDEAEMRPEASGVPTSEQTASQAEVSSQDEVANSSETTSQEANEASLESDQDKEVSGDSSGEKRTAGLKRSDDETDRDADDDKEATSTKKLCSESRMASTKKDRIELIRDSFLVQCKVDQQLVLVSLNVAAAANRHDQFELSVASNILRESLAQHLSEYMLTALIEDFRSKSLPLSASLSSQELSTTTSDSNNNNKQSNSRNSTGDNSANNNHANTKEQPVDRYINIAFSFFDASQLGFIYSEDLAKLFANTGLGLSKRELTALLGDSDRFDYRFLPDLPVRHPPGQMFRKPAQFNEFPGGLGESGGHSSSSSASSRSVEFEGVTYDVERLVRQANEAERLRLSMVNRFNFAIENSDKQSEEIHSLEASQRSLSIAMKGQNEQICELKRERDQTKKKLEALRKGIKTSTTDLMNLIKDDH